MTNTDKIVKKKSQTSSFEIWDFLMLESKLMLSCSKQHSFQAI